MARFLRNTVILAKLESTEGTDAVPTGLADAMLVSNVTVNPLVANNVPRDLVRGYFGGSEQLVGPSYVEISFDIELAGSGTATTPTQWGRLLQACGMAQTIGAASVDYTPVSTFGASSSLTIYVHMDGQVHKALGSRGTWSLQGAVGERPVLRFRFLGTYVAVAATANPSPTLTAFRTPVVPQTGVTAPIRLGAVTYSVGSGGITGGSTFTHRGLQLDLGNNVVFQPLIGATTIEITQRETAGSFALDLDASNAATFFADVVANSTQAFGLTHGTTAGNTVVVYGPRVQLIEPTLEDVNGQFLHRFNARFIPSSGNDEIRIVTR